MEVSINLLIRYVSIDILRIFLFKALYRGANIIIRKKDIRVLWSGESAAWGRLVRLKIDSSSNGAKKFCKKILLCNWKPELIDSVVEYRNKE